MADWRWNLGQPGADPSDIAGATKLHELPAPGGFIDHVFTVGLGGVVITFWSSEPREPNEGDIAEWFLDDGPSQPSIRFEIIVPNAEISLRMVAQRTRHDGTSVEGYGGPFPLSSPGQALNLAQIYNIFNVIPGAQGSPPVLPSDRMRFVMILTRSINKGSDDVTMRLGNHADTWVEVEMDRKFPIMRNTAAAAVLLSRRASVAVVSHPVVDIARLNFSSATDNPPSETFPGYQNIDLGLLPFIYPVSGFGVNGDLTGGYVGSEPEHRDLDSAAPPPDERYDSFHFTAATDTRVFRLDVPDGVYLVRVIGGSPDLSQNDQTLSVNGVAYWTNVATAANVYNDVTKTIVVTAGKIEVTFGGTPLNSLMNWLLIQQVAGRGSAAPVVVSSKRGAPS